MGALECFHLSLNAVPSMSGVHYLNDYAVVKDYALKKGFDAIELLNVCHRLKHTLSNK